MTVCIKLFQTTMKINGYSINESNAFARKSLLLNCRAVVADEHFMLTHECAGP